MSSSSGLGMSSGWGLEMGSDADFGSSRTFLNENTNEKEAHLEEVDYVEKCKKGRYIRVKFACHFFYVLHYGAYYLKRTF